MARSPRALARLLLFILALLLTGRTSRTLPVGAAGFITDTGVEWGRIMAMGTLIVIPPLLTVNP